MVVRVSSTGVRNAWSRLVRQVEYDGETVVVLRCGRAVAALVSMADFERIGLEGERAAKVSRRWWGLRIADAPIVAGMKARAGIGGR